MKTCERCGKSFKFLQYTYYTTDSGKQIILCDNCRKIVEEKIDEKEKNRLEEDEHESLLIKKLLDVNRQQEYSLQKIESSIDTIKYILLVFFVLFIIGIILILIGLI